jgi:hypothetical protein
MMTSGRIKLWVSLAFVLALLGGAAGGMLLARHYSVSATPQAIGASLIEELQLNPQQQVQMRKIWQRMSQTADDCYRQAQQLDQQREDGFKRLLTPDQLKQYQAIQFNYQDHYTALEVRRRKAFEESVTQTKEILNPNQRQRYQAILDRRFSGTGEGTDPQRPAAPASPSTAFSAADRLASPG